MIVTICDQPIASKSHSVELKKGRRVPVDDDEHPVCISIQDNQDPMRGLRINRPLSMLLTATTFFWRK